MEPCLLGEENPPQLKNSTTALHTHLVNCEKEIKVGIRLLDTPTGFVTSTPPSLRSFITSFFHGVILSFPTTWRFSSPCAL